MTTTTCSHDDELIAAAALGLLAPAETQTLDQRLAACPACLRRLDEYRALAAAMPDLMRSRVEEWPARAALEPGRHDNTVVRIPAHRGARRSRIGAALSGLAAAIVVLSLIGGYWALVAGRGGGPGAAVDRSTAARTATPQSTWAVSAIGPVPQNCAPGPTPVIGKISGGPGISAIGGPPLWLGGFTGPHATLTTAGPLAEHGAYGRLYYEVDATFNGDIDLTGVNLRDNTPLWFDAGRTSPDQIAISTTPIISHVTVGNYPAGGVYLPAAGCYALRAVWPGGSWYVTFAAGDPSAPPADCSASPAPKAVGPLGSAIGGSPLWIAGFDGPQATMKVSGARRGEHGLYGKIVWGTEPGFSARIALTGASASDDSPLWFQFGGGSPTTTPVLDPAHAGTVTAGATTWATDAGYVFIPGPGCYRLSASWPGGGWSVSFLAV